MRNVFLFLLALGMLTNTKVANAQNNPISMESIDNSGDNFRIIANDTVRIISISINKGACFPYGFFPKDSNKFIYSPSQFLPMPLNIGQNIWIKSLSRSGLTEKDFGLFTDPVCQYSARRIDVVTDQGNFTFSRQ